MTNVVGVRTGVRDRLTLPAAAVAVTVSLAAWPLTGRAVSTALVAVGGLSVIAGIIDARTCRIPNRVVVAAVVSFAVGGVVTMAGDHRPPAQLANAALAGLIASGAPLLAVLWVLRPAAIGAGDVKLLTVQGITVGLLAPLAAPLVLLGGASGALVASIVLRRSRGVPLGPGFAIGFITAVAIGMAANVVLGGTYA